MVFLFVLILFFILIVFSKIKIEIINLKFSSKEKKHTNKDYQVIIKLCILGKIPILKSKITKEKIEKSKLDEKIKNIDLSKLQNKNISIKKFPRLLKKIDVSNIYLYLELGTENAAITSMLVPAISTFLAIILREKVKNFNDQTFIISPIYNNQNLINLVFSGIFEIKMIHIINMISILNKKEGVKKNERTSNRRTYDYSYE